MEKHPLQIYDKPITFTTSEALVSFVSKFLNIENADKNFTKSIVELAFWIASELAIGKKVLSSDDKFKDIYEIPKIFNDEGLRELMIKRTKNYNEFVRREDKDLKWLESNLGES